MRSILNFLTAQVPYHQIAEDQDGQVSVTMMAGATILVMILGFGIVSLYVDWDDRRTRKASFWRHAFTKPLTWVTVTALLLLVGVNLFVPECDLSDPSQAVKMGRARKVHELEAEGYRALIAQHPDSVPLHFALIRAHYQSAPSWRDRSGRNHLRDDPKLVRHYEDLTYTERFSELGQLCLGLIMYYEGSPRSALVRLDRVNDKEIPFYHFLMGLVRRQMRDTIAYEAEMLTEIRNGGYAEGAFEELGPWYLKKRDFAAIDSLMQLPGAKQWVPTPVLCMHAMATNNSGAYLQGLLRHFEEVVNVPGLIAALLIMLLWTYYLRSIDVFTPGRWPVVALVLAEGALYALVALSLYDLVDYQFNFRLTGQWGSDFLYSIMGIGLIEEAVKITPLLLLLAFSNEVREPVDYIVYACLGALGFATVENVLYFDGEGDALYFGRAIVSVSGHLCYSAIIGYALVLARFRHRHRPLVWLFGGLVTASVMHGLFDAFLLIESADILKLIPLLIHLFSFMLLGYFINNCLNQSPFGSDQSGIETGRLAQFLVGGLVLIMMFEFLSFSFNYGPSWGTYQLLTSVFTGTYSIAFAALNLSNIDIMHGEWLSFRPRFKEFRKNYNKAVGMRVRIRPMKGSTKLQVPGGRLSGKILNRVKLQNDNRYYAVQLDEPFYYQNKEWKLILIRPKANTQILEVGETAMIYFILPLAPELLDANIKDKRFYWFIDWAWADGLES